MASGNSAIPPVGTGATPPTSPTRPGERPELRPLDWSTLDFLKPEELPARPTFAERLQLPENLDLNLPAVNEVSPDVLQGTIDLLMEQFRIQRENRLWERDLERVTHSKWTQDLGLPLKTHDLKPFASSPPPKSPPPRYDLKVLMDRGLEPGGEYFNREYLPGLRTFEQVPESALLHDPEAVKTCQQKVQDALARHGPLTTRQLVRATGLPEDLIKVLVEPPSVLGGDKEVQGQASLFASGVVDYREPWPKTAWLLPGPDRPDPEAIRSQRAETEGRLPRAEWASYLDREYVFPHLILERLKTVPNGAELAGELPFTGLTGEVAEALRGYFQAVLSADEVGRERAIRELFALKPRYGMGEFGDRDEPTHKVRRSGISMGGNQRRQLDNPYYVSLSRDFEAVQELLGLHRDEFSQLGPLSGMKSAVTHPNDNLMIDLSVARLMGRTAQVEELRSEVLGLHLAVCGGRYARKWQNDPFDSTCLGTPIMACGKLDFKDLSDAEQLAYQAVGTRAWARLNDIPFPLSPRDASRASERRPSFDQVIPEDWEGVDFAALARMSLGGHKEIPYGDLHGVIGFDASAMREKLDSLREEPWVQKLAAHFEDRPGHGEHMLWQMIRRLEREPNAEEGDSAEKLAHLYAADVDQAVEHWWALEQAVQQGGSRQQLLQNHLLGSTPAASMTAGGGLELSERGLTVGGVVMRARRRQ